MKNNIKKSSPAKSRAKIQHAFRNIREPICTDVNANTVLTLTVQGNSTTSTASSILSPLGLRVPRMSVNGASVVVGPNLNLIQNPSMRWLYNTSQNFGKYRVTRANLIFVGSVGTTSSGQLILNCVKDVYDIATTPQVGYATGPNSRVFDLSNSGSKELKVPIPVDSSWKKVSSIVSCVAASPFQFASPDILLPVNSVNDLAFGAVSAQLVGFPLFTNPTFIGNFFIDYDVEFGDPESNSINP